MHVQHLPARPDSFFRVATIGVASKRIAIALACLAAVSFVKYCQVGAFPSQSLFDLPKQRTLSMSLTQSAELATGINGFGSALFTKAAEQAGNGDGCFLSPWGVAHALAMLLEGVEPGSASHRQLQSVVFGASSNSVSAAELNDAIKSLAEAITQASNGEDLIVSDANSAWVAPRFTLQQSYTAALTAYFNAQSAPLTSAATVNDWVSKATRGKITSIIDDSVARQAALILVNAIYFKGTWQSAFPKGDTASQPFHRLDGSQLRVPMMFQQYKTGRAAHAATLKAQLAGSANSVDCVAVKLAYKGGAYSAVMAMPQADLAGSSTAPAGKLALANGVDYAQALAACGTAVLASLSPPAKSLDWVQLGAPTMQALKLYLPRFEIEFGISLGAPLQALGLTAPFTGGDITRIAADRGDLRVSGVVQKVYCKVDEQGTEAAAVTAVVMVRSAVLRPPSELVVRFDRPFVFAVVHEGSGLALFNGEVYKPEAWKG